jgi:hypothetical protein
VAAVVATRRRPGAREEVEIVDVVEVMEGVVMVAIMKVATGPVVGLEIDCLPRRVIPWSYVRRWTSSVRRL